MKTKVFAKLAVVAMAAFGAFAFNGNAAQQSFYVHQGEMCNNVEAPCSPSGDEQCEITLNAQPTEVWNDLECSIPAYFVKE